MFLREGMEHNKFDYSTDIIRPLKFFLKRHRIIPSKQIINDNVGFFERPSVNSKIPENKSQYWTNFNPYFMPIIPELDKNGKYIKEMSNLGFGFIEIGTITPKPQPGNPKKRLFRVQNDLAIINRLGINNDGSFMCAERLKKNGKKVHSTQKPESLLHRVLLASSNKNDLILDPFLGSGTTATVAKKLGRNYFGVEKEKVYFKAAEQRLKNTKPIEDDLLDTLKNNRSKPRIPFGSLVELGIIKPGTNIFDNKKKISARIMADGSIKHEQTEGSIHKVAATILGAESCNGWTYWHCDINGRIHPIDYLRQRLISKN